MRILLRGGSILGMTSVVVFEGLATMRVSGGYRPWSDARCLSHDVRAPNSLSWNSLVVVASRKTHI